MLESFLEWLYQNDTMFLDDHLQILHIHGRYCSHEVCEQIVVLPSANGIHHMHPHLQILIIFDNAF